MFCTNCGNPLSNDARFCVHCGQAVQAAPGAPAPQPAPEPTPPVPEAVVPAAPYVPPAPTPPPAAPAKCKGKGKRVLLILISVVAAVAVLAVVGVLAFRVVSDNLAFIRDMASGQEYMDSGDYAMAADAFESALEYKPDNMDASLALVRAYLYGSRFDQAERLLTTLPTPENDAELLDEWEQLNALSRLSPTIQDVNIDAFPVVTVTLQCESDLVLTADHFTVMEDGSLRQITGLADDRQVLGLTYLSEDTGISEELRSVEVNILVDGVSYEIEATYTTPRFDFARISLVSTDVSEYPKVKAYFRVTNDTTGENVDNLSAGSFTILEQVEGGEYLAREVKSVVPLKGNAGLNIGLVADKSDSISSADMLKIKGVMTEFVNSLDFAAGDKAELLAFDSIVQQMCYYTNQAALLVNGIGNMSTDGLTAFYDAVYDGVTNAALQGGARCVIAFTDGMDNRSRHSSGEVVQYAIAKQVPVYIIGVGGSLDSSTLRSMAESTGGRYWHINDLYDLQEIFNQIYSEQKELYMVEYESDAALDSYLTRTLDVQISGSDCRGETTEAFTPVRSINDDATQRTSRYELFIESLSWEEASRRCQEMGGHLATITSQDEMDLLSGMAEAAGMKYVWLGGYTSYDDYGNVFGHWVTGEEFSYEAWSIDEPSRVDLDGTEEWYIMLWNIPHLGGWTWNDQRLDPAGAVTSMADQMAFICEFED